MIPGHSPDSALHVVFTPQTPHLSVCVYPKAGAEIKPQKLLLPLEHQLRCSRLYSASFSLLLPTGLPVPLQDQFNLVLGMHQLGKA